MEREYRSNTYKIYADLRAKKGVRDNDVAKAIGANQTTFTDWKQGNSMPKIDKLVRICRFFGVDINVFVDAMDIH